MKKTVVKVVLAAIWLMSAFVSSIFWLAVALASDWGGFPIGSFSAREWFIVVMAHALAIGTALAALRYDRTWP